MNAPTFFFFSISLSILLAACGSSTTSASGSGGSTTSSAHGSTTSTGTGAFGTGGTGGAVSAGTGGAESAGTGGACATNPTFAQVLAKPLSSCSGFEPPCHNAGAAMLKIDATMAGPTWSQLVNVPTYTAGAGVRVVPGDPENSFLYRKLTDQLGPNDGLPMPHTGLATGWNELPADEIEMVRCWIREGAPND